MSENPAVTTRPSAAALGMREAFAEDARAHHLSVIAHRGDSGRCIENTAQAVAQARTRRADGLEVDLMLSADGHVVVFHDDDLLRLARRRERVDALTWAELQRVDLGGGERILDLAGLLAEWPDDCWLNLELKAGGQNLVDRTLPAIRERKKVVLSSSDPVALAACHSALVPHELAIIVDHDAPAWLALTALEDFGCSAVHLEHTLCRAKVVHAYVEMGLRVGAWTVNDLGRAAELLALGVSWVFTDFP